MNAHIFECLEPRRLLAAALFPSPIIRIEPAAGPFDEYRAQAVAAADFDGDGDLDAIVASDFTTVGVSRDGVVILTNDGTGHFTPAARYETGLGPNSLVTADFNGDGWLDFAVGQSAGTERVTVFLNDGAGAFAPAAHLAVGTGLVALAAGDVDADGDVDLVAANNGSSNVTVLFNGGDGTGFTTWHSPVLGASATLSGRPVSVALVDVDNDGRAEIVTANNRTRNLSILRADATGTFANETVVGLTHPLPRDFAAADLDGDGDIDFAATTGHDNSYVEILRNAGDGSYGSPEVLVVDLEFGAIAAGDVNGDDRADLIALQGLLDVAAIFLGQEDGTFAAPELTSLANGPVDLIIADINGDATDDVLVAGQGDGTLTVVLSDQGRGLITTQPFERDVDLFDPITADLNGDGAPDVLAPYDDGLGAPNSGGVAFFFNDGTGRLVEGQRLGLAFVRPRSITPADLNGDGHLDVLVEYMRELYLLLNMGDGVFFVHDTIDMADRTSSANLALADFDEDGDLDVALGRQINLLQVLPNMGDGTFGAPLDLPQTRIASLRTADFNGDGLADLLVGGGPQEGVWVLPGQEGLAFGAPVISPDVPNHLNLLIADFDGDGDPDMASSRGQTSFDVIDVALNNGDGTFVPHAAVQVLGEIGSTLAAADMNGDGRLDLVASQPYRSSYAIIPGMPGGTFDLPREYANASTGASSFAMSDLDRDGDVDLISRDLVVSYNRLNVVDQAGPRVVTSSFHFESAPHAIAFRFDEDVGPTLDAADFHVIHVATGQMIPPHEWTLAYNPTTRRATLAYAGGILPDGNYVATLPAGSVGDASGNLLAADVTIEFFVLSGDANRDRNVNLFDLAILRQNFGQSPRTFTQGDFNYDGAVNLLDLAILRGRFGTYLPPPGGKSLFGGNGNGDGEDEGGGGKFP